MHTLGCLMDNVIARDGCVVKIPRRRSKFGVCTCDVCTNQLHDLQISAHLLLNISRKKRLHACGHLTPAASHHATNFSNGYKMCMASFLCGLGE